jgi:hypothetical protein
MLCRKINENLKKGGWKMKKNVFLVLLPFLAVMLIGGCAHTYKCPKGLEVTLPTCTKLIKYDAGKVNIGSSTVTIPATGASVKIGGVIWSREKLQTATKLAMLLDNQNYQRCQNIPAKLSVCKTDNECRNVINNYDNREEIMNQFVLIIEANSPKALDKWLDAYFAKEVAVAPATKGNPAVASKSQTKYVLKQNVKAKQRKQILQ